jgi:hypothetical protein
VVAHQKYRSQTAKVNAETTKPMAASGWNYAFNLDDLHTQREASFGNRRIA